MKLLAGLVALIIGLVAATAVGLLAGAGIGLLLLAVPVALLWAVIPRRRPRPGPTPR